VDEKNKKLFEEIGIFSAAELHSRSEIMLENYCKVLSIEAKTMLEMAKKQFIPAVNAYSGKICGEYSAIASCGIAPLGIKEAAKKAVSLSDKLYLACEQLEEQVTTLKSIKESKDSGIFPFLNPVYPEVRELVMSVCEEIVTKYDVDGLVLDYCRYQNANSDFSEASKAAFEEYAGVTCTNFPYDIYYYPEGETDKGEYKPSTHYNKWMEWRSSVIQGYVKEISERVKAIKPDISLQYWAAAWWPLPGTGQNWASQKYTNYPYWWATDQYYKTGFADYLDVFQNGAYYSKVTPMWESGTIAHALYQGDAIIKDACLHYSSFSVANSDFDTKEATKYSYLNSDGVMIFELCYMVKYDWWDEVKAGIQEAEAELGIVRE
jgi:hypothetical protein